MKEGGLFNVQPMSRWDTILKKGGGGGRGGGEGEGGAVVPFLGDGGWKYKV